MRSIPIFLNQIGKLLMKPAVLNLGTYVPRPKLSKKLQDSLIITLFLLPAFILFIVFLAYPILQSIYISFFKWNGFGPATDFQGFQNYARVFGDPIFIKAMINGMIIVFLSLLVQLPLSLALAIMVGRGLPGRGIFRTIFFMPYVFSEVITGLMWLNIYQANPSRGFLNAILTLIPGVQPIGWLGDFNIVMISIFIVLTWKYFGFHMLLYMAGLQNIPLELEEAAIIDGANKVQLLRHITLPLLVPTIKTTIYLSVLGSLQVFALVWVMTRGGPVNATEVMATYLYQHSFIRFELGYGSAVAMVMLAISLVFSVVYLRVVTRQDYLGGV
jgi:raffinose/stachyose/melibiose transport system permease protein